MLFLEMDARIRWRSGCRRGTGRSRGRRSSRTVLAWKDLTVVADEAGRLLLSVADPAAEDEGGNGVKVGEDHQGVHQLAKGPTVAPFRQFL